MQKLDALNIKIFADGADIAGIREMAEESYIKGFTTNPTLMRKAGISDYKKFAMEALSAVGNRPISFEVFADDFPTMETQALEIASWGKNVNVKIPITNTKGESSAALVGRLSKQGVACNVTAMFTAAQIEEIMEVLSPETPAILSIFAGRISDTGVDPMPIMKFAVETAKSYPKVDVLWASPREILNLFQAEEAGCGIITATNDMLKKISLFGKDLTQFSLETVAMFYNDAKAAGYTIDTQENEPSIKKVHYAA